MRIEKTIITTKINKLKTTAAVIASAVCFLSSCTDDTMFFSYHPVDNERWEKSDDLKFKIIASHYSGECESFVVLRSNEKYPFKNLSVNVETTIKDSTFTKRVDFDINSGIASGFRHNDYVMPVNKFMTDENDTIYVRIAHNMKHNVLHGITDVGIKITKH